MTKSFLIATVAAFAITAPAQAAEQRERRASSEQAKQKRGDQRVARAKAQRQNVRAQAPQARAAERRQNVRAERPQVRQKARTQEVRQRVAAERPQVRAQRSATIQARARSQARVQERVAERRTKSVARAGTQRVERQRIERQAANQRVERQARSQRVERQARSQRVEGQARMQRVERQRVERQRVERQARSQRVERQARAQQLERQARNQRVVRNQGRGPERRVEVRERNAERFQANREQQRQRLANIRERNADRFESQRELRQRKLQQLQAQRFNRIERNQERREMQMAQQRQLARVLTRPSRNIGDRIDLRQRQVNGDWFDSYRARRYSRVEPSNRFVYNYNDNDGYLYKVDRNTSAVAALFPVLGGAFSVAQPMPVGYSGYNVPSAYRSLYYDTPNTQYRYGDGAIYRVNPETQLIQTVVALLTGQNLGVGQMLPTGYDVYNVPSAYRQRFVDRDDMWYRYNDGNIYGVDPYSRRIQSMYPVSYGGYNVGYPVPSYASYGGYTGFGSNAGYGGYGGYANQQVPYGYQNLYNRQPGYNYQYGNGGIYQVDPTTQLVSALVALVTGTNLGVGQVLPTGYDAYNVPSAYRSTYFDTPDSWYRYNNGNIYQVDPYSRMVQASIPVSYGGYMVGQPVPAAYQGYAVPSQYSGLYNAAPGYDYRYFDGGIYQVNPLNQVVESQAALLTGQTFGVGQMMPAGYDAYNVPFAYRDRYYDRPNSMYRYADGNIYQVDPTTRLIQAVISAII